MRNRLFVTGICSVTAIAALTGCSKQSSTAAGSASADAVAPSASVSESPTPAAVGAAMVADSDPAGKFKLTVPAGFEQGTMSAPNPVIRLITAGTADETNNGDYLVVESLRGTSSTPESRFSSYESDLRKMYPKCTFGGADHIAEAIKAGFSANYVVYKCDAMPFSVVNFTTRGPAGLQVAGYERSTKGDVTSWKAAVGSIVGG